VYICHHFHWKRLKDEIGGKPLAHVSLRSMDSAALPPAAVVAEAKNSASTQTRRVVFVHGLSSLTWLVSEEP